MKVERETALEIRHLVPDDHVEAEHRGVRHLRSSAINVTASADPAPVLFHNARKKRMSEPICRSQ
jgi:hypothetical protein